MDFSEPNPTKTNSISFKEIRPRKAPFLLKKLIPIFILTVFLSLALSAILYASGLSPWPGIIGFVVMFGFGYHIARAIHQKERYEIHAVRLVCHRGGMISDEVTEFEVRNITHVKIKLPWLRYKCYGVGDVIVETAGSSQPLVLRSIQNPEAIYSDIADRMRANGYDLSQQQLLHEERPSLLGVIIESIGMLFVSLFVSVFAILGVLSDADISLELPVMLGIIGAIAFCVLVYAILHLIDCTRRVYRVYNDVVVYEEGFLTRENAFIPYENISDSDTKRTLIDQILGLYDVRVSCQGSSSEIKFRRLKNGILLSQAIDQIVTFASQKARLPKLPNGVGDSEVTPPRPRRVEPQIAPNSGMIEREYRISARRALIPMMLIFPLIPLWIAVMIDGLIRITSTRYFIRQNSIRYAYNFLRVDEREFSCDKVTGVEIKRNLWDKCFGTMTVKFLSIGASKPIEFMHVPYNPQDIELLLRHVGIPVPSAAPYEVPTKFDFMPWLRSKLWLMIGLFAYSTLIVGMAVLRQAPMIALLFLPAAVMAICALVHATLYYRTQSLKFHDHHVHAQQGILFKHDHYVRYKNIKRLTTTRYPGGEAGSLQIFIAGEEDVMAQAKQQNNSLGQLKKQSTFTTHLIDDATEAGRLLDDILCGKVDASATAKPAEPASIIMESSLSTGHALFILIALSIVIFPFILLLPIAIPVTIFCVRRWRYRIEDFRVVWTYGVLFRKMTTVLFDRVDSIQKSQGPLNKIFRNGTVSIMTAGSSRADLVLFASPDYLKLYDEIRRNTQ